MDFPPSSQYPSFSTISIPNYEFKGSPPSASTTNTRSSNAKRLCHGPPRRIIRTKGQKHIVTKATPSSEPLINMLSEKLLRILIHDVNTDNGSVTNVEVSPTKTIPEKGLDPMFDVERLRSQWSRSFPSFSQLPVELRMIIWQLALPRNRVLTIKRKQYERVSDSGTIKRHGFAAPVQVPTILHVNREARSEALRYYQLSFGGCGTPATIYFDPLFDTVYFWSKHMRAIDVLAFLAGASNVNTITSIAISGMLPLMPSLSATLEEDQWGIREIAKKNLMVLQTAVSISTHDPKVSIQDVKITSCAHNDLGVDNAMRKRVEEFLGVKLKCAHVMWRNEKVG